MILLKTFFSHYMWHRVEPTGNSVHENYFVNMCLHDFIFVFAILRKRIVSSFDSYVLLFSLSCFFFLMFEHIEHDIFGIFNFFISWTFERKKTCFVWYMICEHEIFFIFFLEPSKKTHSVWIFVYFGWRLLIWCVRSTLQGPLDTTTLHTDTIIIKHFVVDAF